MTDERIIKAITQNFVIAVILRALQRDEKAQLFTVHGLKLIATHRDACQRWIHGRYLEASDVRLR